MAKTHPRSPSPEPKTSELKRLKIGHQSSASYPAPAPAPTPTTVAQDMTACFTPDLFSAAHIGELAASYATSQPFKHVLVEKLFQEDLLQQVKDECLSELHFTEKETDIYKVRFVSFLLEMKKILVYRFLTSSRVHPSLITLTPSLFPPGQPDR
jgi:prolyl 3-hydroxylase /prolyl 3,4-dihydroxylase